ncbi:MAG TPA: glycosyltransferase family 4 protein [Planctomicrobium sp.]|nr:glycosyltransferase family 4 protein [Planctomicrobium sp.]
MQHDHGEHLKVLLLVGSYQLRGSYSRTQSLAEYLPNRKVSLSLISSEQPRLPQQILQRVKTHTSRYLTWPVVSPLARHVLACDLRAKPPDLIDIQHRSLHPLGMWLARRMKCPYIVTIHDYLRDRERFVIDPQWCQRVIAVSDSVREELLERTKLPESLVSVISSGVQTPPEQELSCILNTSRAPVIGTAGPLEAGKGLQHFLRAAVRILKSRPDTLFLIAGSGPEERSLRSLAMDLQISHAVTILPNLHDFTPALKAMDIFVLPALKQGLGSTMLDAMAWGLPVVASESGGVFSVVVDGMTGFLVPPSDDVALAERMRFLLENPDRARELGCNARKRIQERFDITHFIDSTISLYREVSGPAVTTTLPSSSL